MATPTAVLPVASLPALKQKFNEAANNLVVLFFSATWCESCTLLEKVLEAHKAGGRHGSCVILRIEAEETIDITQEYNVSYVPLLVFVKDGKEVDRLEGYDPEALDTKLDALDKPASAPGPAPAIPAASTATVTTAPPPPPAPAAAAPAAGTAADRDETYDRIDEMLHDEKNPIVLFLKGTPGAYRCGFSRKVGEALADLGLTWRSVDILSDEAVRQHLKEYSQWPTFPQLYVKGELLGGCDIVLQLRDSGELRSSIDEALAQPWAPCKGSRQRIKDLLQQHPVILFMKGSADAPRCGFSGRVVSCLKATGHPFFTVDILAPEEQALRQMLKEVAEWPTYPMLFVRGELLGGCDIVEEMHKEGRLKQTIDEMLQVMP